MEENADLLQSCRKVQAKYLPGCNGVTPLGVNIPTIEKYGQRRGLEMGSHTAREAKFLYSPQ